MKLKSEYRMIFIMVGLLFAWFAILTMVADFYERWVEAFVSAARGGEYHPYYFDGGRLLVWLVYISISSLCLAIGLKTEEIK